MSSKRKHHYVPIWYQKRFQLGGQSTLCYLDLHPEKVLPDGRQIENRALYHWGPGNCFKTKDLYTTRIFGKPNNEIEQFLFGQIDNDGSNAINALVHQDYKALSKYFTMVFEYLDAQKLRTPKGLDWIKSKYFNIKQLQLMLEMQHLRRMHCTMWVEGVMEIVSAANSDIKFIISDHPVSIYNRMCFSTAQECRYPDDPPISWMGTQTIFPLDYNHCFILTNLEYARNPNDVDPKENRTNPRSFGNTITRWDIVIRDRKLNAKEVSSINYIVKMRARKYIAGTQLEWLYPEKVLKEENWENLHKVLLPPENEIWKFGGKIFVGGKDGKLSWYQDAFGRTHTSEKDDKPSISEFSTRKRNIILFNAINDIFGLSKGKDWNDVRRQISNDEITELYKVIASLWPPDTDISKLLQHADDKLTAFYSGNTDPRIIPITVIGYSLYTDRIIVLSPFMNPWCLSDDFNPIKAPSQYKQDTLKSIIFLKQLIPLINEGIVELIPDPCDFDPMLRKRVYEIAQERLRNWKPDKKDFQGTTSLMKDDSMKLMLSLPPEHLMVLLKKMFSGKSDSEQKEIFKYIEKIREDAPFALLQTISPGKKNAQIQKLHLSGSLEIGLFLSQMFGAYMYTEVQHRWEEILGATYKMPGDPEGDIWAPLSKALKEINYRFFLYAKPRFICHLHQMGFFKTFRKILLDLSKIVSNTRDDSQIEEVVSRFAEMISEENKKISAEWSNADKELNKWMGKDFDDSFLRKLCIQVDYKIPLRGFGLDTVSRLLVASSKGTKYQESVPMSVFINTKTGKIV